MNYLEEKLNVINHDIGVVDERIHEITEAVNEIGVSGVSGHPITIDTLQEDKCEVTIAMGIDLDIITKMLMKQLKREFHKRKKLHDMRRDYENRILRI